MATASKIQLSASQPTAFSLQGRTDESAKKASELLQENHEKYHIFFNKEGFHDHIVHHLLTVFALGANPETLKKQYDGNANYQRRLKPADSSIIENLHDPEKFKQHLGDESWYHEYLEFFREEIEKKGWEGVLNEYLFSFDERGDDLLVRMYAGFLHPLIHLGFGIEFAQPAIIAEALAQAAVHENWIAPLYLSTEKAAKQNGNPSKSLVQLLQEIRADEKLSTSAHWADGNKIRDGILARAPDEMIKYASQYVALEDKLSEKTAEMINAAVFYTGAAQHPPHHVKFDFYYMHCVNCSIFFPTILQQSWLSTAAKIRLLEWKARTDLAMYASRRSPPLLVDEIKNYTPAGSKKLAPWDDVFARAREFADDGHTSKLVRAIAYGEKMCREFEGKEGFEVKGDMWLRLGNMVVDSVGVGDSNWVRSAGFEEAWENVPLREGARL